MFVYVLIAAELALLYFVFWYLYVREPRQNKTIRPSLWGNYNEEQCGVQRTKYGADPTVPFSLDDSFGMYPVPQELPSSVYSLSEEWVLDKNTNRYVAVDREEAKSLLMRMAVELDRKLSKLNVRP